MKVHDSYNTALPTSKIDLRSITVILRWFVQWFDYGTIRRECCILIHSSGYMPVNCCRDLKKGPISRVYGMACSVTSSASCNGGESRSFSPTAIHENKERNWDPNKKKKISRVSRTGSQDASTPLPPLPPTFHCCTIETSTLLGVGGELSESDIRSWSIRNLVQGSEFYVEHFEIHAKITRFFFLLQKVY